jgi:membrane protease YdiL (CAAX protease family)
MFNRYWREYPWLFQFVQFIILVFVFGSFFTIAIIPILAKFTGVPLSDIALVNEHSSRTIARAAMVYQLISSVGIFLIPAFLFGYFTHPRPLEYLGLKKQGKQVQLILVVMLMLGILPVMVEITSWLSSLKLTSSLQKMQEENERITKGFLTMPAIIDFLLAFLIFAIVPAIGEELFFRGVMFRLATKKNRSIKFSIVLTALVFALFHFNVYGFPAILIAGTLLGFIYYITGSLWMSIVAHLLNNGLQIVLVFFLRDNVTAKAMIEDNSLPWYLPVFGFVLFVVSFYLLWQNRTPLPPNWPSDFDEGELQKAEIE